MLAPQPRHLQTPIRYAKHLEEEAVKPQIEFIGLGKKHFTLNADSCCSGQVQAHRRCRLLYIHTRTRINTHVHTHAHTDAQTHTQVQWHLGPIRTHYIVLFSSDLQGHWNNSLMSAVLHSTARVQLYGNESFEPNQ